ncbi:MAG TPA: hypothetical protein PLP89_09235, partial [Synergistales bacterium]|nr:hypothetical protein [Synergistales bacterium]
MEVLAPSPVALHPGRQALHCGAYVAVVPGLQVDLSQLPDGQAKVFLQLQDQDVAPTVKGIFLKYSP